MNWTRWVITLVLMIGSSSALSSDLEACFEAAASRYHLPSSLLMAIGRAESGLRPAVYRVNADGSEDIGVMQINAWWLPRLEAYGITRADLEEPCTNIQVGAWILAQEVIRFGYTWEAVGAYNAGPSPARAGMRRRYALRVARHLEGVDE